VTLGDDLDAAVRHLDGPVGGLFVAAATLACMFVPSPGGRAVGTRHCVGVGRIGKAGRYFACCGGRP
jgi:hypothetical protein